MKFDIYNIKSKRYRRFKFNGKAWIEYIINFNIKGIDKPAFLMMALTDILMKDKNFSFKKWRLETCIEARDHLFLKEKEGACIN